MVLTDAYMTVAGHCAPPDNKPTAEELGRCRPFLRRELELLPRVRVVLVLGRTAFDSYLRAVREQGSDPERPAFAHGAVHRLADPALPILLCSYHPSRQNTQTGRLAGHDPCCLRIRAIWPVWSPTPLPGRSPHR